MAQPQVPAWVADAVFYQIFPDRFARGVGLAKPRNLEAWDAPPTVAGYKGGDLVGLRDRLDYLQDLGITALYLNPIFAATANHRYHTADYLMVDPLLGGNAAFAALRDEVHRRGMRLMLDGVFNHCSRGHLFFSDVLENGPASPWIDYFTIQDWPLHAYDETGPANYECWWGLRALPRWNTDHPAVREYLMRIGEHWVRQGIDGWRLDVPNEIHEPGFWEEFRQRVRAINPATYIVGEIWSDASAYLAGDQFDAVMNYLFTESVIQFIGQERTRQELVSGMGYYPYPALDAAAYANKIDAVLQMYPPEITAAQFNLLASHDTARLRDIFSGDEAGVRLATLLLCTFPGTPCIYYGDEIGLPGGRDPDNRRAFPWDHPEAWNTTARAYHRQFIALRQAHPALRHGTYHRLSPSSDATTGMAYAFARQHADETIIVAINAGTATEHVPLRLPTVSLASAEGAPQVLLGPAEALRRQGDGLEVTVPPRDACVLLL
ncbi:MAG: DUF3459 domain-containing protein [Ktedonobacterales bacterium]|nr:DUF3459 domain-containing protein [Ktedonobacterales bacterium]